MDCEKLFLEELEALVPNTEIITDKIDALNELSLRYLPKSYQTAFSFAQRALELAIMAGYQHGQAVSYAHLANVEKELGDYSGALNYAKQALEINTALGNKAGIVANTSHIGLVYSYFKDSDMALKYYQDAIMLSEGLNDTRNYASLCMNIGNVYRGRGDLDRALKYHKKAQDLIRDRNGTSMDSALMANLGEVYRERGETGKALKYFTKALDIARATGDGQEAALALLHKGITYNSKKDYEKAEASLRESERVCKEFGLRRTLSNVHKHLHDTYKIQTKWKEALQHHEAYHYLKEELAAQDVKRQLSNLEVQKQLALKDKEVMMEREQRQALAAAQEELMRKDRMATIGTIATEIAHEVQNPLQFVNNFSCINIELLDELQAAMEKNDSTEVLALMKDISNNSALVNQYGKRAGDIVNKLLAKTWENSRV